MTTTNSNIVRGHKQTPECSTPFAVASGLMFVSASFLFTLTLLLIGWAHINSQAVTLPYRSAFLILCLISIAWGIHYQQLSWRLTAVAPLTLFFALYAARVILDGYVYNLPLGSSPLYYLGMAVGACFIPALAFTQKFHDRSYKISLTFLLVVGAVLAISTSIIFRDLIGTSRIDWRLTRIAFNPLHAGHFGAVFMVLGVYLLLNAANTKAFLIGVAVATLGFPPFALGASRAALLSLIIGTALTYTSRTRQQRKAWPTILLITILLAGTLTTLYSPLTEALSRRLPGMEETSPEMLLGARLDLWRNAWYQFTNAPLAGSGLVEEQTSFYPHNLLMEAFISTGIVGGICLTFFFANALLCALKLLFFTPAAKYYAWVPLFFIHSFNYSMFSGALYSQTALWCMAGAVIGLHAKYHNNIS